MRKYTDITGQTFADLTAVSHQGSDKDGNAIWLFKCICGNEKICSAKVVKKGDTLSCGCRRSQDCAKEKTCRHCGQPSTRKNRHGNLASVCQKCNNKQTNGFKTRNPKVQLVISAKVRAKKFGIPCTITAKDIEIPEFCPVLGVKLESGNKQFHENSPSLDRIIPELGYVPGNVAVMSFRANRIKGDATMEELKTMIAWLESKTKLHLVA